jgi:hypothetical protein
VFDLLESGPVKAFNHISKYLVSFIAEFDNV